MTSSPSAVRSPRRRTRLRWWALGVFVAAVVTGLAGGYGAARLQEPSASDQAEWTRPEQRAAPPQAAGPNPQPGESPCVPAFDIYSAMHHAYAGGVDFSESRLTAAEQMRQLADLYPEPDRTHLNEFADVLAADAQVSGDDSQAVTEAVDREGDAWLAFIDLVC